MLMTNSPMEVPITVMAIVLPYAFRMPAGYLNSS